MNNYYTYLYLDPTKSGIYPIKGLNSILKYEPFYVGKGKGDRLNKHLTGYSGRFMKNKIKSLQKENINPIIYKIIDKISNFEACENEKYLIKVIGRRDLNKGTLCNLTNGGEGVPGNIQSKETRKKKSKALKGRTFSKETIQKMSKSKLGKLPTLETRLKMSNTRKGRKPMLGKKHSKETKLKIILANTGRKNSEQSILKMQKVQSKNIKVLQYDLDMNFIEEYFSISEAARQTNSIPSKISFVCKNKRKKHNKFIWKYKAEEKQANSQ